MLGELRAAPANATAIPPPVALQELEGARSILVIPMLLSSHLPISRCHMAVSCGKFIMCYDQRGHPFGTTTQLGNAQ